MKNFQKELLYIANSISKLAVELDSLANDINGKSMERKPAKNSSPSEAIVKEAT